VQESDPPYASDSSSGASAPKTLDRKVMIRVEDLSICYRITHGRTSSIKEYVIRRLRGSLTHEDFWALRGVNLIVHQGEVYGIIGRNGAGKSTLLKVLARVLRPLHGRVMTRGQVAPLLEVGAGFHPELTGRENVFLNATLLGHSREQAGDRFCDIVSFAELDDFIDFPLRTYSSGMVARLGFAIAVAWKPDIMIVDEMLSVGDTGFQRKCLDRMRHLVTEGTTVLLVSHNVELVNSICDRALWLESGTVRQSGPARSVLSAYMEG
jgi:ABC-2 type transport system ATP-binding protein/lipopolysaccharide transport system ATP-binding protein